MRDTVERPGQSIANSIFMTVRAIPFSANVVHRIIKSKIIVHVGLFLYNTARSTSQPGEIRIGRPQYHSKSML